MTDAPADVIARAKRRAWQEAPDVAYPTPRGLRAQWSQWPDDVWIEYVDWTTPHNARILARFIQEEQNR